jgi:uncharacterized protein (DUF952 family)
MTNDSADTQHSTTANAAPSLPEDGQREAPTRRPTVPLRHLVARADWDGASAVEPMEQWRPPSLQTEGFVHLSLDSQVVGSRQRHFSAVAAEELLVVEVDAALLDAPLRWEAPPGRPGERYPHVYGPLPLRAIRSVMTYDQWLTMSSRNDLRESS